MKTRKSLSISLIMLVAALILSQACFARQSAQITVCSDDVNSIIDEKVYGHFLEHIYHSVNGGLWGEMVWNRSFEEVGGENAGLWIIEDDILSQQSRSDNVRLWFGDTEWTDYEYSLQAKKTGGSEGFLILFRGIDNDFYWCNFGGWGNVRHSIEKNIGRNRNEVGSSVDASIEEDKWYDIKIRCEQGNFKVWLDDDMIIDYDDTNAHLKGRVGLGTWSTQVQYRNIAVKDLDGNTLFEGLPDVPDVEITGRYFIPFGKVKASVTEQQPFNSDYCQHIQTQTAGSGIMQHNFSIEKGHTYSGSLYLKGSAPGGLSLKLLDANEVLDTVRISPPSNNWKQHGFVFHPDASSNNATLKIELLRTADIYIDQLSMMDDAVRRAGGCRPDLLDAVAELRPPIIRWPGGCFASPYRWKDGIGPQEKRKVTPRPLWDDIDINSYGTDEFIQMCHKIGAEPLIVVNIGTDNWNDDPDPEEFMQDVLDWIEYCNGPATSKWGRVRAQNGHPEPYNVKYWEIDNETWHMGREAYAEAVKRFAPPMRKKDPSIKLLACGSGGFDIRWNRYLINECAHLIDYLSIHHYENPDRFAQGPYNYENFIKRTANLIKDCNNPELKIYCSEWNAQTTDWRTGLYAGGVLNSFERCSPTYEIGGPALFLRHIDAPAWDNAFINFDQYRWFPAPNYVVMKLWRDHYAPKLLEISSDTESLNTNATLSDDGGTMYIKCVNPTDETIDVMTIIDGSFKPSAVSMKLVAPGSLRARNTLERPDRIKPECAIATINSRNIEFTMPEFSAAVVIIEK